MYFWKGIIVDRDDPMQIGRHRVRIIGYHSPDREELPDNLLPWAYCVLPTNSKANSGSNGVVPSLEPNTNVLGYFEDSEEGQVPIICGILHTIHNESPEEQESFDGETSDNGFNAPKEDIPTTPVEVEGVIVIPGQPAIVINALQESYPRITYYDRTSVSPLATNPSDRDNPKIDRKRNTPEDSGNLALGIRMAFAPFEPYEVAPQRKKYGDKGEFHDYGEKLKGFLQSSTFNMFPPVLNNNKDANNKCIYTDKFKDYTNEQLAQNVLNNISSFIDSIIKSKEELWAENPGLRTYKDIGTL